MRHDATKAHRPSGGFTLAEMLIAVFIFMITLAGALSLFLVYRHTWVVATLARDTSTEASFGLERIVYGVGTNAGLRAADFASVGISYPSGGWRVNYNTNRFLLYSPGNQNIVDENGAVLCQQVIASTAALTNGGCLISLTVRDTGGGHVSTNTMSSFVQFRN